ncbi:MAG: hypothetical protein ACLFWM_05320 [Actinomycetota bacterium]
MGDFPDDPVEELESVRWTCRAVEVLDPDSFVMIEISTRAALHPSLPDRLADTPPDLIFPVLERGRVGRRLAQMHQARETLERQGLRVAVTGHRIASVGGFDLLVVSPRTAGADLDTGGRPLLVRDARTGKDLAWARDMGASLVEGPAVADPLKVAPVDLSRLRRR